MTPMIRCVDSNIFIERWSNPQAKRFTDNLDRDKHCSSVLVPAEVYNKLMIKNVKRTFDYIRRIMG